MITTFIHTTLSLLGSDFRQVSWPLHAQKCRLSVSGYFLNSIDFLTTRQERLKFRLGSKSVITINDGSIIIQYSLQPGRSTTWGIKDRNRIINPVVSIEVSSRFILFSL